MLDSIGMIEKLVIREALDAQPASVLWVIRVPGDLYDLPIFLMNQDAAPGHAPLTNRPDDFFFHVSPPGNNSGLQAHSVQKKSAGRMGGAGSQIQDLS
jgi:hypothetical protein